MDHSSHPEFFPRRLASARCPTRANAGSPHLSPPSTQTPNPSVEAPPKNLRAPRRFETLVVHLGLPNCSLNRRSFRSGFRPPRAIEIFSQGGREDGRTRQRRDFGGARYRLRLANSISAPAPQRKYFLIRASESENAFSPPQTSRPPVLPVKSRRPSIRGQQHDSSPKRSLSSALRRHGSFCKEAAAGQPRDV